MSPPEDSTDPIAVPATAAPPSLRRAVVLGSFWMVGMRWSIRGIALVNTVVLARLLAPTDFGLMAMAMVVAGFIEILFEFGVNMALIQQEGATRDHWDTAWTLQIVQSGLAGLLIAASAPFAARYYDDPRVMPILLVVSVSTLLGGFANIGVVAFSKDLRFGWEYTFRVLVKVLSVAVAVVLAFVLRNYWALVFGALTASIVRVVSSYMLHPYRPRFSLKAMGDIWSFSQWVLVNQMADYLSWKVDRFIIGGFTLPRVVGLYTVGGDLAEMPSAEIVAPLSRSLVPGFAKLQRHADRLRRAFLNALNASVTLGIPAGIGLYVVAPAVVPLVLGDKWTEAVPLVQILSLYAVTRVFFSTGLNLGMVTGKMKSLALLALLRAALFLSCLYWAFQWGGIEGVAWAKLATGALNAVLVNLVAIRRVGVGFRDVLGQCWRPAVASGAMALVLNWTFGELTAPAPLPLLVAVVAAGAAVYLGLLLAFWLASGSPDGIERAVWRYVREVPLRVRHARS